MAFRQIMVDPNGGEFVAGSPEVVARLKAQGYREKPGNKLAEDEAKEAEREQRKAEEDAGSDGGSKAAAKPGARSGSKPDGDAQQVEGQSAAGGKSGVTK